MAVASELIPTSTKVSARMSRLPRRDTLPELAIRHLVHQAGLRYIVDARPVPSLHRRADLVFRGPKIAAFVDGCYWHGCPDHCRLSGQNLGYWTSKIDTNRQRDADTDRRLTDEGWEVFRAWTHECPEEVAAALIELVRSRSQQPVGS